MGCFPIAGPFYFSCEGRHAALARIGRSRRDTSRVPRRGELHLRDARSAEPAGLPEDEAAGRPGVGADERKSNRRRRGALRLSFWGLTRNVPPGFACQQGFEVNWSRYDMIISMLIG